MGMIGNSLAQGLISGANIQDGTVDTPDLKDNAVTTAKITDANVTTAKIADSNVTTAKVADGAITTAKIADGTIATGDIADSAVTTAKITDANVTAAKLASGAAVSNIGYTPVNKAGDTLSGDLTVSKSSGTSTIKTFSSNGSAVFTADSNSNANDIGLRLQVNQTLKWLVGMPNNVADDNFSIFNASNSSDAIKIDAATNQLNVSGPLNVSSSSGSYGGQYISYGTGYGKTMSSTSASSGPSGTTYRIGYISRHYWGSGPVYLTVVHAYYSDFRRSRYAINGDSKAGDGWDGFNIVVEYEGGAVNAPYIGTYSYFSGDSVNQYAPILITVPGYNGYNFEWETTYISVYHQAGIPPGTNSLVIHPSPVAV